MGGVPNHQIPQRRAPFLSRSHQSVLGLTRAPIQAPPPINSANSRKTGQTARAPRMIPYTLSSSP